MLQFDLSGISRHPPAELCEIRLNLRTGTSELISLQPGLYCDFPRVRQDLLGELQLLQLHTHTCNVPEAALLSASLHLLRPDGWPA